MPVFYDHESDGELTLGRRAVADWGGDDVFSHAARRRFSRAQRPPRRASGPVAPPKTEPVRKTVTITGHPGALAHTPRPSLERRRPQRSVTERVGHRPDHVAAFAFAMGLLLILVAIATAHAG
jgi:hypothetical protein